MHQTVHMLDLSLWSMPQGCWLDEALAYRYPVALTGTTTHYCVAPRKEDYAREGAALNWLDASQWKTLLKGQAAKKDDMPLRAVVAKSAFELPIHASIKAWSVVDFLMRRDRAAFSGMLAELK